MKRLLSLQMYINYIYFLKVLLSKTLLLNTLKLNKNYMYTFLFIIQILVITGKANLTKFN